MKFGKQLSSSINQEYHWYYIDYDGLKGDLPKPSPYARQSSPDESSSLHDAMYKRKPASGVEWTEEDETRFLGKLEAELDKVYTKQRVKAMEISRRIACTKCEVHEAVDRLNGRELSEPGPTESDFMLLEEDLSDIIADVHDLAKFVQLNYTGFCKIIKKHDKVTGWLLKPVFDSRLKAKPFYKENYDAVVVELSRLYDLVRTRGHPVQGDSAAGGNQANFVRHTTKYWVHPDNVTEVKLIILKHLPVLVFNPNKNFEPEDTAITSIYFDNPDTWSLYQGRLKKTEGAEAIRLRWYGGMKNETIFVERKTHREDWTGEKSVKARFSLKEKNVNAYLRGKLLPKAIFEKARREGKKPEKAIVEDERLAAEIQYSVLKHGYKPICRSFYNRTAFQLPADARVRISLDTELAMLREDNLAGRTRSGDNWRRTDIGIDYPFSQVPLQDIVRFPYAILEVKLQTQLGQEPPAWVRQLISSHLVEAVPKFSKFIHGVSCLFPDKIKLLPYWAPQMDVDIRKPTNYNFGIHRPHRSNATTANSDDDDEDEYDSDDDDDGDDDEDFRPRNCNPSRPQPNESGPSGATSSQMVSRAPETRANDVEDQTVEQPPPVEGAEVPYESDEDGDTEDRLEEAKRVGGLLYYFELASACAHSLRRGTLSVLRAMIPHPRGSPILPSERQELLYGNGPIQSRRFKAPRGKRIHVPLRVEPKVYFAAERTFLGWLEFSIYIGTIAVTLLNFSSNPRRIDFVVSGLFTLLAIVSLCYSLSIYLYRSEAIRKLKIAKYYDKVGPTVLCVSLFAAVTINFVFEGQKRGFW